MRRYLLSLVAWFACACDSNTKPPPAAQPAPQGLPPMGGGGGDPHAGMGMGDPHAGMAARDPHAGMAMDNPHGAMGTEQPPPPLDPNQVIAGTITIDPKLADKVKPGSVLFISVRPADPATGQPAGGPMAVAKMETVKLPATFQLDNRSGMGGSPTRLAGHVHVRAWTDADGDAASRAAGDIEGKVLTDVPARHLEIVLDTVVP